VIRQRGTPWIVGGPAPALRWPRTTQHIEIHESIAARPPEREITVRTSGRTTQVALPRIDAMAALRHE
jgi:hypothetical protein